MEITNQEIVVGPHDSNKLETEDHKEQPTKRKKDNYEHYSNEQASEVCCDAE